MCGCVHVRVCVLHPQQPIYSRCFRVQIRTFLVGFERAVETVLYEFSSAPAYEDLVMDESPARRRERKNLEEDIESLNRVLAAFNA